ncbi:hypothetical protein [Rhodococcus sp. LB1]|uniref:hypothetical protein n=1 Tax=Rhodococcus sp. LB1 TaxID=1807499 RepID=UPI000779FAF6|nr:hypothetical protein [Rhodococcus sp. LB1]KXX57926.1 hypothetical protein AZG88_47435 [Rhodococcus sp. LB1]
MARNSGNRPVGGPELTVGVRVLVRKSAGADLTGGVVEDYADDGRLVFADTEDLTIDPGSYRSAPNPSSGPDSVVRTPGRHRGE